MRLKGFVGPTYQDRSRPVDAQRTINLFPEKVESGAGKAEAILRATPGYRVFATLTDTPLRGLFSQDNRAFAVAGSTLFEIQTGGVPLTRGTVAADGNPAWFASGGQNTNQLLVVSAGYRYILNLTTGALAAVSDSLANTAVGAGFLDGYFLTRIGPAVHASNLNDGATWSASSKAQRSITSDELQAFIVDDHRILWFIGAQSSEPWFDNALSPFAFTPVPSAFMAHGTCAPASVVRFDNTVFMLAQGEAGSRYAVVVGNGYTAQRISTSAVESAWSGYSTVFDARSWVYSDEGHTFVVVSFPTAEATWVYDASTGAWHERGFWNAARAQYEADLGSSHCYAFGKHLVGSRNSPVIYEMTLSVHDYNGSPRRWLRRTPHVGRERQPVIFDRFELVAETGVGLLTGQGSDPLVSLRASDDGGRTWGTEKLRSLGAQGGYTTSVEWHRLGRSRDRVFEVAGSDPVVTTLIDAYVDVR